MEPYILTLKYIFKKNGKSFPEDCNSLEEFFQNGISFPQLVSIIYDLDSIPNTTKVPKNIMAKNINNNAAFDFLSSKNSFFKNINSDFSIEKNRVNIIKSILEKEYIKSSSKDCLSKCNEYLKQNDDKISNFSEFSNIIGFLKLFSASSKCSVADFLIQFIKSYDAPVVIDKESFKPEYNDILMFQALLILEHLKNDPIQHQIPQASQRPPSPKEEITKQQPEAKVEIKLSTNSNLIFDDPPKPPKQIPIADIHPDLPEKIVISTQTLTEIKKKFLIDTSLIVNIPLQNVPSADNKAKTEEIENKKVEEASKKALIESQKAITELQNSIKELRSQKEEIQSKYKHQYEEKEKLNEISKQKEEKLKKASNEIENLSKQIKNLNFDLDNLKQLKKNLENVKNQEIERLNGKIANLESNFKNLQINSENQKAALSAEIKNLKKQINDLSKQKEVAEIQSKKQDQDQNQNQNQNRDQDQKLISESKESEKPGFFSNSMHKIGEFCHPFTQLLQSTPQEKSPKQETSQVPYQKIPSQDSSQPKQVQERHAPSTTKNKAQSATFMLSLPGLMNFI